MAMAERVESASGREVPTDEISSQVDVGLGTLHRAARWRPKQSYALPSGAAPDATPAVCLQRNGKALRSDMNKFCRSQPPNLRLWCCLVPVCWD